MSSSARAGTYLPLLSRAREVTPLGGFQSDAAVPDTVMDAEVVVLGMMSVASVGAVEPLDAKLVERIRDERWSWVNEPRVEPVEKEGIASSDLIKGRPRTIQIQIQRYPAARDEVALVDRGSSPND